MSEFSHLKNKLLAEQVEDQIYHYILDEALEPGAKLPNEFALGEKFRGGRSTSREAVKLLSSKGIVEVRQGSGTYVVTTVKGLSDPLNLRSVQDKNALAFDLVNVRLLLEPGIAELAAQTAAANGWYYMNWLANDDYPEYHRRVTGPAIVQSIARQNQSLVDARTIGVGSAGTVTGVGETIKAWTNDVRFVAVEPYENQVLGGGLTGPHGIPDIGYGIVPENYNSYVVDNVSAVASRDAQRAAQQVLRTDAIPASVSAGAALHAAAQLLANCNSRAALAIFSGRASIV